MTQRILAALLLTLLALCQQGSGQSTRAVPDSYGLTLPELDGPKPWSDKPVLNDPASFQFAIVTDRTGGHRPGVWMHGVRGLNLMRPEFVVSVGDLIEGYSEDEALIENQWREFLGFIDKLDMRFFFVAGNHDLTNPLMHRIWRERFGPEWYSFDYKGVHFVCLCSEDPQSRLGDEQLAWLEQDLKSHDDARWTFVLLHKPLWAYSERNLTAGNPDTTNWKAAEKLLVDRPHTVFAGHVHHYVEYDRNGMKYYHLATTGGGSRLRGQSYGEFDHVVWVTMEKDGPRIALLRLDGILSPNAVTEKGISRFREFLAKSTVQIDPILIDSGDEIAKGTIAIHVNNRFSDAVEVGGSISGLPLRGLTFDSDVSTTVAAGQAGEVRLPFQLSQPLHFKHFSRANFTAKIRSVGPQTLSAEVNVPITIDRRFQCPPLQVVVDGDLQEWQGERFETSAEPIIVGASDQWQGPTDASLSFRIGRDERYVFVSGQVQDDYITDRDRLIFTFDMRSLDARTASSSLREHAWLAEVFPSEERGRIRARRGGNAPMPLEVAITSTSAGYDFEAAVPIRLLEAAQGDDWKSFQLNATIGDVDAPEDENCFILWRGTTDSYNRNTNFGQIFRSTANDE